MMGRRTVLFLDYQNVYRRARDSFHQHWEPPERGQVDPMRLGRLLTKRNPGRELAEVRVYRGRPDSSKDPRGYGANRRQCTAWEHAGVTVITRTLRYPANWPREREEEKGIDVALAVDFVVMAVRGEYDVGILMSTDTDLKPALEAVVALGGNRTPHCEVAAWSARGAHSRRLSIKGTSVWCQWLNEDDYRLVADPTKYAVES
jgi:uncharacterized LabA/DUF88 family protein